MGAVTDGVWLAADIFFTWFALVAWLTTACFPMLLNVLKHTEQRALAMAPITMLQPVSIEYCSLSGSHNTKSTLH